jgi:hypothetical protein
MGLGDRFGEWKDRLSEAAEGAQAKAEELIEQAKESSIAEQAGEVAQNAKLKAREIYEDIKNPPPGDG